MAARSKSASSFKFSNDGRSQENTPPSSVLPAFGKSGVPSILTRPTTEKQNKKMEETSTTKPPSGYLVNQLPNGGFQVLYTATNIVKSGRIPLMQSRSFNNNSNIINNGISQQQQLARQGSSSALNYHLENKLTCDRGAIETSTQKALEDVQKIKDDYENYKNVMNKKVKEQGEEIFSLRELLAESQLQQWEDKKSRMQDSRVVQKIYGDLEKLLEKVESMPAEVIYKTRQAQEETKGVENGEKFTSLLDGILVKMNMLEEKFAAIEISNKAVLADCTANQDSFKNFMNRTDEKLDQIIKMLMIPAGTNQQRSSQITDGDLDPLEDYGETLYDNFHLQEESSPKSVIDEQSSVEEAEGEYIENIMDNCEISILDGFTSSYAQSDNELFESQTSSQEFVLEKNEDQNPIILLEDEEEIISKKKNPNKKRPATSFSSTKTLLKKFGKKKRMKYVSEPEDEVSDDEDIPPVLTLPPRIVKDPLRRIESMPILLPEIPLSDPRTEYVDAEDLAKRKEKATLKTVRKKQKKGPVIGIKKKTTGGFGEYTVSHVRDHSVPGFSCICGSKFTGAGGLYVHQVKLMENAKFGCTLCEKRFHYFSGLKAHQKTTHKMPFTAEVGCSRCGQVFGSKKQRQGHRDEKGQTCWLSGSYQSKNWETLRNKHVTA